MIKKEEEFLKILTENKKKLKIKKSIGNQIKKVG
jgi:hypothetical protein